MNDFQDNQQKSYGLMIDQSTDRKNISKTIPPPSLKREHKNCQNIKRLSHSLLFREGQMH